MQSSGRQQQKNIPYKLLKDVMNVGYWVVCRRLLSILHSYCCSMETECKH